MSRSNRAPSMTFIPSPTHSSAESRSTIESILPSRSLRRRRCRADCATGEFDPGRVSGRVWVKCDATLHAIEIGDLLTTSATPGHAMTALDSERSHGTVIGKAMTALPRHEKGFVLVLVNLH